MEPTDRDARHAAELPAIFPENSFSAAPLDDEGILPAPNSHVVIPLPNRDPRPRIVIVDDDPEVIAGLGRSLEAHYLKALDVRFYDPASRGHPFLTQLMNWMKNGWRPDAIVIDINMSVGGQHGVHYLQDIRERAGCAALVVVLATGNQYRDLDEGRLTFGRNLTGEQPGQWFDRARKYEPEAILYGKTADATFLGRIGEHLSEWQRVARRRAWVKLLGNVAQVLDGASIKVETVAETIVSYAVNELEIDDAFVRWRTEADLYELVAVATARKEPYVTKGDLIDPKKVPVLNDILENNREPVLKDNLSSDEAGTFGSHIANHRFLGVGMVLGNRSVGFITLLRSPERRTFEEDIDGQHLAVLARLLASALGRDALMRGRQTRLLAFAKSVAQASQVEAVCHALAKTLHQELHDSDDTKGKTTVRLLDFGSGVLTRWSHEGMPAAQQTIAITDLESIYAERVRENNTLRIADVRKPEYAQRYKKLSEGVRSELCVPLAIGEHAIGATNLEHIEVDFYRTHDEGFVEAAAGLAANAIERIRTAHVLDGITDFVHRFALEDTAALDFRLRELLYDFCSYSVLVDLELRTAEPWSVHHVECKFLGTREDKLRHQIESSYANQLENTWVNTLYRDDAWRKDWAHFTKDEGKFLPVTLVSDDGQNVQQSADALLWLRRGDAPPHRALLLMWYLPPPMNDAGVAQLGNLARLFSELDNRQHNIRDLMEKNLIGEQAAQIGYVMQHFRHRLGNLTGSQTTHIDRVDKAHQQADEGRFTQAMQDLRANARDIANSFHRSRGYVKDPELAVVLLQDLINKARTSKELKERLLPVNMQVELPAGLQVCTDLEIASLVLFSLLENALDAVTRADNPIIRLYAERRGSEVILSVADNGSGVPINIRQKLFEWGVTTKSDGLGSALAFARTRMKVLNGQLVFPTPQPSVGAVFEIRFPSEPQERTP